MALSNSMMDKYSDQLTAYKSACEEHPHLKSFDSSIQQQTKKAINSFPVTYESKTESLYAAHKELSQHVLAVTKGLAEFVSKCDYDVWESKALKDLVEAYFESTQKTLRIFNTIENCVDNAEMGQLLIRQAVADFEKESAAKDVGGKRKKYEKTLMNLKKFKAMGDPFDGQELTTQFELLKKQQLSLIEEVCERKKKLNKKISNLKKEILIVNMLFGAAFSIVTAVTVVQIATPMAVGASIAVSSGTLLVMGWKEVDATMNAKKDAMEKQLQRLIKLDDIQSSLEKGIKTNEEALNTVSSQVHRVEDRIKFMLKLVHNAIENEEDEEGMRLVLETITAKVDNLLEKIKEVGKSVENHSKLISEARLLVLEKINGL